MQVICRQLGFSQAVEATAMSAYPEAQPNERVWVEGLECEGGEGDIGECGRVGEWGDVSSTCLDHSRDAGAICAGKFFLILFPALYFSFHSYKLSQFLFSGLVIFPSNFAVKFYRNMCR